MRDCIERLCTVRRAKVMRLPRLTCQMEATILDVDEGRVWACLQRIIHRNSAMIRTGSAEGTAACVDALLSEAEQLHW